MLLSAPVAQPVVALPAFEASSGVLALPALADPLPRTTTLSVRRRTLNVLDGHEALVTGTLAARSHALRLPGRIVSLQAFAGRGWSTLARARTGAGGEYRLRFRARRLGSEALRLRFAGDPLDRSAHRRIGRLNVFRVVAASWYGGGGRLACGGELTSATLGVANKTLPCGTLVTLRYGGHLVRVPVVDRGPYVAGRELDLTQATKQALGFGDTGQVWSTG